MPSALFTANDGTNGNELWVTDGTAAGTVLLKDINAGAGGSSAGFFVTLSSGSVLFNANDGTHGPELWISNGTPGGTSQVADIRPGYYGSNPVAFTEFAPGKVLFSADNGSLGSELWVTDGTPGGTSLLKDIRPSAGYGNPSSFMVLSSSQVLFSANDGTHGGELWTTDGTAAGTSLLVDLDTRTIGAFPRSGYPNGIGLGNGKAVFTAVTSLGNELWVSDGTPGGTSLLVDIIAGSASSYPNDLTALGNGMALFTVNDGTHDVELWVTDGTTAGTHIVKDINTHPVDNVHYFNTSSYPRDITPIGGGRALFRADDVTHGYELWVTDGTEAGTSMIADINGGALDSIAGKFAVAAPNLFLMRADGPGPYGAELWRSDGTGAGTTQVLEIRPGSGGSLASNATLFALGNGQVVFPAIDGVHGTELWVSDGVTGHTSLLKDISAGNNSSSSSPTNFAAVIPCFVAGTRILTAAGERPVETLAVGDLVPTVSGRLRRVVWIGRTEIDLSRHREAWRAAPYRVRAGALGVGVPARDLLLSPDHALAVDGALVPVRLLANGGSIAREDMARVTYLHVELEGHDVLLAEGAPAESFLDTGNRGQLDGTAPALHPDFSTRAWDERSCLPLLLGGERLASLRRKIKEESSFFEKKEAKKLLSV